MAIPVDEDDDEDDADVAPVIVVDVGGKVGSVACVVPGYTSMRTYPNVISELLTVTVMSNHTFAAWGVVANVKVAPPSLVVGKITVSVSDETAKSAAVACTSPTASRAYITHVTGTPCCSGAVHSIVEAVVGGL